MVNHCFRVVRKKKRLRDLVVFLLCQQVVESFVDGLVVVTLDRPQVRFDQLQLVHLVEQKQPKSCQVMSTMFGTACLMQRKILFIEVDLAAGYLAEKGDSSAVVQPRRQNGQQVIQ